MIQSLLKFVSESSKKFSPKKPSQSQYASTADIFAQRALLRYPLVMVSSVLGGILAQEATRIITRKANPVQNCVFFDIDELSAGCEFVDKVRKEGVLQKRDSGASMVSAKSNVSPVAPKAAAAVEEDCVALSDSDDEPAAETGNKPVEAAGPSSSKDTPAAGQPENSNDNNDDDGCIALSDSDDEIEADSHKGEQKNPKEPAGLSSPPGKKRKMDEEEEVVDLDSD